MQTLLYITSSLFGDQGKSSQLTRTFVENLRAVNPDLSVIHRDLSKEPVPHLDSQGIAAFSTPAEERTAEQRAVADLSDQLIDEWTRADTVVIALPMYNLGVPSSFKAYIDHIARAGETFRYTESGPQGLLRDRKVHVVTTRGGIYVGTPIDTQTAYIRHILGLMGITDIDFTYAEGLNMGGDTATKAMDEARLELQHKVA